VALPWGAAVTDRYPPAPSQRTAAAPPRHASPPRQAIDIKGKKSVDHIADALILSRAKKANN